MTAPRSVAIVGSCITADNFDARFNPDYRRWYSVVAQSDQSSPIALMAAPAEPFLADLVAAQPDYLILDFFGDVRDGVLRLDDPDAYVALWVEAMDRFAAYLAQSCPSTLVIVHHGFYASEVVTGSTGRPQDLRTFASLEAVEVDRANAFWARLDEHAASAYGWASIDLRAERYTSSTAHPRDAFWVHYSLDYYRRFLAELHRIDLGRRLSAEDAAVVDQIGAAASERAVMLARFTRRAVRAGDHEVARLEGLDPLNAARAARQRRAVRAT